MISKETILDYLAERHDFLQVAAYQLPDGGWDICLRLDGTYTYDPAESGQVDYSRGRLLDAINNTRNEAMA